MVQATQTPPVSAAAVTPVLAYQVAMPHPESHLFEVTLQVQGWRSPTLDLKMPVWTPGSYLVREYARHVQGFAVTADGQTLAWQKLGKNHWQVSTDGVTDITVRYRVFANELSVRTNHLDGTHGYFNGAALFFYIPGYEAQSVEVTVMPPRPQWHVSTPLPALTAAAPGQPQTFVAADFDTLVDSPFEVGEQRIYQFETAGKPHQLAIWGKGNLDADRLIADMQAVIQVEADVFGGLPYDSYLFLLHLTSRGFGGLEHKACCSLIYNRFGFRDRDKYNRFIQLVAHEFFHLWNVKRIRPQFLTTSAEANPATFAYGEENYTPCLWFSEGTTSYYDLLIPLRAKIYDAKTFLTALGKEITRFQTTPGRLVQPLAESSFDAWIKLYRPDANSANSQMSYYLKGEMVSLLLDLLIRQRHQNGKSLDDVLRQMWQQFGQAEIGFSHADLLGVIEAIAETDLSEFFHRYLYTTEELPLTEYLEPFGLQLKANGDDNTRPPHLGITLKSEAGREVVKFVEAGSPAWTVGVDSEDDVLAIDGLRVTAEQLSDRLLDYKPGDRIALTLFHQDELRTYTITLAAPKPTSYQVVPIPHASEEQAANYQGWLGEVLAK